MLKPVETEIIRCVSMGFPDSEIASRLGWEQQKVEDAISIVCLKLNVTSRLEVVFYALSEEGQTVLEAAA